jgi:Xaa-Pro aminopeptidase
VVEGAEKKLDAFETLTLAPIDRRLIDRKLLSHDEMLWLDRYHGSVRAALTPLVDPQTKAWLDHATASLTGA